MRGTMLAVVKTAAGEGHLEWKEMPIPQVGPKDILVKVHAAAICGTDIHIRDWHPWAQKRMNPPVIIGHEFAGEVVEIGASVASVKVGDRVSSESHIACNNCQTCRAGNRHVCPNTRLVGVHQNGGFAEYVAIPEEIAFVYNDASMPWEQLALMEPFGVVVHGVMASNVSAKIVVIIGAGPLGSMGILAAKAAGAARVIVVEPNETRAQAALARGADLVIDPVKSDPVQAVLEATDGLGPHAAIDFSGSIAGLTAAVQYLRPEGILTSVAHPSKPFTFDLTEFAYKGCSIRGIAGRRMFETWEDMRGLLQSGVDLSSIISHQLPLENFAEGMGYMDRGESCKVILHP